MYSIHYDLCRSFKDDSRSKMYLGQTQLRNYKSIKTKQKKKNDSTRTNLCLPDNFNGSSAIRLGSSGVPNGKGLGPKWKGWNPWFPANELNNRPNTRFNLIIYQKLLCINSLTGFRPRFSGTVHCNFDGFRVSGYLWRTRVQHYRQRKTFAWKQ